MIFKDEAAENLKSAAAQFNQDPIKVITLALSLLRTVGGRKIILKEPNKAQTYEIREFEKYPAEIEIKK